MSNTSGAHKTDFLKTGIRAICQTPDGYLWIGTSGGLARFDGVRFVVYARYNTPTMTDDNIRGLTVAKDGSLWVATDGGGLLHLQDGHFGRLAPTRTDKRVRRLRD